MAAKTQQLAVPDIDPKWCSVEDSFDIATNRHFESVLAMGTGYMTTRGSIDEGFADDDQGMEYNRFAGVVTLEEIPSAKSKWGTYMPAIGARHPFLLIGIANLPHYLRLVVSADGEKLDLERSEISSYCRWLDLKTATLYRHLVWKTRSGSEVELLFTRFMDPDLKFTCVQNCSIAMLSGSSDITVEHSVYNDVKTNGYDKYSARSVDADGSGVIYSDITTNLDARVITASRATVDRDADWSVEKLERQINSSTSFKLNEGESAVVKKASAVAADTFFAADSLLDEAAKMVNDLLDGDTAAQHEKHAAAWAEKWDVADIEIDAADHDGYDSQLAARKAVYHLLRSRSDDHPGQTCPKGTTSEVYFGGCFWDMEICIYPFYVYTSEKSARTTPMYRHSTLQGAKDIAKALGYRGAKYPWTSAFNGTEVCPMWEFAEHQIHITADVVMGIWHYFKQTNDMDTLCDYGLEVMVETARYWMERVDKVPGRDGYHLFAVMGPDEYKVHTNNNAYTNFLVRYALQSTVEALKLVKAEAPDKYAALVKKLDFEESEVAHYAEVADGIPVVIDAEKQIVWQCEGFDEFPEIDIDGMWKDRNEPCGVFISQEKRFRSKCMKQSDTVVLFQLFPSAFTKEQMAATFDYYAPFNTHDSSNSMVSHMITAATIGRPEVAYDAWKQSMDIDFGSRPRSSDGIHMANVGGMWQEVTYGFVGFRSAMNADVLTFDPCMPKELKSISMKLLWKGSRVKVTVTNDNVAVENLSDAELAFKVKDQDCTVGAGQVTEVKY